MELATTSIELLLGGLPVLWHQPGEVVLIAHCGQAGEGISLAVVAMKLKTRQKRNLLIFVTANLVSPGGSPARQRYRTVEPNSLFQNPTIMTPSGSANRRISADTKE
jgi:hypothetical protein